MKTNAGTTTKNGTRVGPQTRVQPGSATVSEVNTLIKGIYDTACALIHERATRLSIEQVCAVFDRRLALNRPKAAAIMRRLRRHDP